MPREPDLFAHVGIPTLTVAEVTAAVKSLLEGRFPDVWVSGEVSGIARPKSGHVYLTLKDEQAQLRGVLWKSAAQRLKFNLTDGLEVLARGRITVYEPRGEYQLTIEDIQPKGLGALELAFRQLKEQLEAKGWFRPERKRPLPRIPRRVALVTSPTGAVIRDMLRILRRRWPALEIWLVPVPVQGAGAAAKIAAALDQLNAWPDQPDLVVVARGGGSLEDLWAFNEIEVAAAIFRSAIPVVSAVGHETDVTIADLVADRRAATPSEAAEMIVPDRLEMLKLLTSRRDRLASLLRSKCELARERLNRRLASRVLSHPRERFEALFQRLDDLDQRLQNAWQRCRQMRQMALQTVAARLHALSPLKVLARGYSLTEVEAHPGKVVRSVAELSIGTRLLTRLVDGQCVSVVEGLTPPAPTHE
jgi:exodeoxyribonuclease VII large subunit